jgi:hypothetical protein
MHRGRPGMRFCSDLVIDEMDSTSAVVLGFLARAELTVPDKNVTRSLKSRERLDYREAALREPPEPSQSESTASREGGL